MMAFIAFAGLLFLVMVVTGSGLLLSLIVLRMINQKSVLLYILATSLYFVHAYAWIALMPDPVLSGITGLVAALAPAYFTAELSRKKTPLW